VGTDLSARFLNECRSGQVGRVNRSRWDSREVGPIPGDPFSQPSSGRDPRVLGNSSNGTGAANTLPVAPAVPTCSNRFMDVRPIVPLPAAGSVEQRAPIRVATPDSAITLAAATDSVAMLQLSPSDTGNLILILDPPALPQQPSMLADLLGGAVSAAQRGDLAGALKQLEEFVKLDPNRANSLRTEAGLEQIDAQVHQLLIRLQSIAGLDAHARLAEAAKALESWGRQPLPGWDAAPQTLLAAANNLYDAGGYINYLRAASLAQVVIEGTGVPITDIRTDRPDSALASATPAKFSHRLKTLWIRAPLLILLVSWFLFGLAAAGVAAILHYFWPGQFPRSIIDSGFTLWGIGFPALIAFGFYIRVRHIRFR